MAKRVFGKIFALLYAAAAGYLLFLSLPWAIESADFYAGGAAWATAMICLALILAAVAVSLPMRAVIKWANVGCGKFYVIVCAILTGLPVTWALWQMAQYDLAGAVSGWLYILFGGVLMMLFPIIALYKYTI